MKRVGHLFEQIVPFANLRLAAVRALRTQRGQPRAAGFCFHLETELLRLEAELRQGTYRPRPYRTFMVWEPKARQICAADLRDRVVHHAICGVLDPVLEAFAITDSYACRVGKGTHRALRRAQQLSRRYGYFLKLDVRHFFAGVDRQRLQAQLARKFKDRALLALLAQIIDQPLPGSVPGLGLPIGNLTSQHLANFYLGHLDHFVKDDLAVKGYVRYMDDLLLFADGKEELHRWRSAVGVFLGERLGLELKGKATVLAPVGQGISFLGCRVYPRLLRLQRASWVRCRRRVRQQEQAWLAGRLDEERLVRSVQSLMGHLRQVDTLRLRQAWRTRTQGMDGRGP